MNKKEIKKDLSYMRELLKDASIFLDGGELPPTFCDFADLMNEMRGQCETIAEKIGEYKKVDCYR